MRTVASVAGGAFSEFGRMLGGEGGADRVPGGSEATARRTRLLFALGVLWKMRCEVQLLVL